MATVRFIFEKQNNLGDVNAAFNEAEEEIRKMIGCASGEAEKKILKWSKVSWSVKGINFFIRIPEEHQDFITSLAQKFGLSVRELKVGRPKKAAGKVRNSTASIGSKQKVVLKPRLCFIYCSDFYPGCKILTVRLDEETVEDVRRYLTDALATLPFRTMKPFISFSPHDESLALLQHMEVNDVSDFPGAPQVTLSLSITIERQFFLPRNLMTGEFINIEDQVRCLSVMTPFHIRKEWATWFEGQKKRLDIKE